MGCCGHSSEKGSSTQESSGKPACFAVLTEFCFGRVLFWQGFFFRTWCATRKRSTAPKPNVLSWYDDRKGQSKHFAATAKMGKCWMSGSFSIELQTT
eukprot:scaffold20185_cov51-Isochrysis_galbana.AAC.1